MTSPSPEPDPGWRWQRHPLRARLLQVRQVQDLSPRLRRITVGGAELEGFASSAPDDHVRLLFPAPGQTRPTLPQFGDQGAVFPPGEPRPQARDYTPRHFDAQALSLTLDFVLHGEGPASSWAAAAQPGDWLGVAGPRASRIVTVPMDWLLLIGDETALPAIARWIEAQPPTRPLRVLAEVDRREDAIALPTHPLLDLQWITRDGAAPGTGEGLLRALRALPHPPGQGYAWIATESAQMRALRAELGGPMGWPARQLYAAGYWKKDAADHDDEH